MKLKISIPLATAIVLVLTLLINIIGLQMSLEKHFPDYIASINERFHKENNINPEWLQALLSVDSLDGETRADYEKALSELSHIASSLQSLSENPELYVTNTGETAPTSNSFQINSYNNLIEQARNDSLLQVFTHPLSFDASKEEWIFLLAIIQNFLILNAVWMAIIIFVYIIWIRRIFTPVNLVIDSLQNFSHHTGKILVYKRRDEFAPLIHSLNKFRSTLDHQEKIRNNLLSDISHEIRTPITAISCFLEAIEDGIMELNPTNIRILQGEISRLIRITEGIMEHEKFLHSIESTSKKTWQNIQTIADEIFLQYKPQLEKNLQKVKILFWKNKKLYLQKEQFMQILHNIFSNFLKYAGKNSTLECRYSSNKTHYILTFCDDGEGMSAEDLPLAKEKFFRADTGRNQNSENSSMGIGLSIIERILLLHNGSMEISHNTPKGFIITLFFPKND